MLATTEIVDDVFCFDLHPYVEGSSLIAAIVVDVWFAAAGFEGGESAPYLIVGWERGLRARRKVPTFRVFLRIVDVEAVRGVVDPDVDTSGAAGSTTTSAAVTASTTASNKSRVRVVGRALFLAVCLIEATMQNPGCRPAVSLLDREER